MALPKDEVPGMLSFTESGSESERKVYRFLCHSDSPILIMSPFLLAYTNCFSLDVTHTACLVRCKLHFSFDGSWDFNSFLLLRHFSNLYVTLYIAATR